METATGAAHARGGLGSALDLWTVGDGAEQRLVVERFGQEVDGAVFIAHGHLDIAVVMKITTGRGPSGSMSASSRPVHRACGRRHQAPGRQVRIAAIT
jgi:hypothetical protein